MLPKHSRLTRDEFMRVFKAARRFRVSGAQILLSPTPHDRLKAAVVVSKKVHKGAVARNRVRRRWYGLLRELGVASGVVGTVIVVVTPDSKGLDAKTIRTALLEVFRRLPKRSLAR